MLHKIRTVPAKLRASRLFKRAILFMNTKFAYVFTFYFIFLFHVFDHDYHSRGRGRPCGECKSPVQKKIASASWRGASAPSCWNTLTTLRPQLRCEETSYMSMPSVAFSRTRFVGLLSPARVLVLLYLSL